MSVAISAMVMLLSMLLLMPAMHHPLDKAGCHTHAQTLLYATEQP